ncbi:MAG TPA: hypothetical protein VFQ44_21900 [Streptosporangiaceae bacterium]|nr:hypothetical protein [Streptosporangiaceae bacterium]
MLERAGACFGSKMGWERANAFAPSGQQPVIEYSWGKPNWLPCSVAEQQATRCAVAVFDRSSFAKYLVSGPQALAALRWLCIANVDVASGRTVCAGMLNASGRYEADVTVTGVAAEEFLLFAGAAKAERDLDDISRRLPASGGLGNEAVGAINAGYPIESLCPEKAYRAFMRELTPGFIKAGRCQVSVGGQISGATISLRPPFDPDGEKVRR